MKIIDYRAATEVLSWFRSAGISITNLLAMRRVPLLGMGGKGAIFRGESSPDFRVDYPIPVFDSALNLTFPELMNATAANILAEGKLVRLAWSGGLDSTGALLALKQAGATAAQVEVYYTDASVVEYPALLPFVQQNFTSVKSTEIVPVVSADSLWVTGEGGDQIFLPISVRKFAPANNTKPWEDYFFADRDDYIIDLPAKTIVRALMAQCPFPVVTMQQAQWFRPFSLHLQHMAYRQGAPLSKSDFALFIENNRPFFITPQWQQWAMKRMSENVISTSYLMIKKPLKDYINWVYPDMDYYNSKAAEGSDTGAQVTRPYVRFEDGSSPMDELEFQSMVTA
jgi:hypothetical protein